MSKSEVAVRRSVMTLPPRKAASASEWCCWTTACAASIGSMKGFSAACGLSAPQFVPERQDQWT